MDTKNEFPLWALLPKKETGVTSFLNKYPEYDGRGVIIAIFDSGVDPGAGGLQVTSDGKPKIIGRFDCSGAGDVDTSKVVKATDKEITGLSGRKLKIPDHWNNPSGEYHIGIKNGYELYPKVLRERMEKERKEKKWDPGFKTAIAEANRKLLDFMKGIEAEKNHVMSREEKLTKEDLDNQIDFLNSFEKKFTDPGPVYDCIVFNDGSSWCCCLDTSECGNLESCTLLKEYSNGYNYDTLSEEDWLNYSVNVYDDGNLLEIVSLCSAHGTHVASVAAAYFPDEPEKNGVAPGAQLISLSIGDNRLDSMETGTSIVRSIIKVMESQKTDKPIHLINMSYGEHSNWSTTGRLGELMNEVVDKYGITWVAAAGNHGPALCTIGTPPDISTDNIIGVGAYVSPEMMIAEYSLRKKRAGRPYTWSSRGPTIDGGRGVSVCAPGGAVTSVPQYTLRYAQLLNGTSMASPHVTGAIALLLSGLKDKGITSSPYSIKRALENTAFYQPQVDHFAQGYGLLQVEKAFDHLVTHCRGCERMVRFNVACGPQRYKGIHLRLGPQDVPRDVPIVIEPIFLDSKCAQAGQSSQDKINFEMSISLACDVEWVMIPSYLAMTNTPRSIQVRVDPTGLPCGVHTTSVRAYDTTCPEKGPVFKVEVTIVRPHVFPEGCSRPVLKESNVLFKPGQIVRHFILVPERVSFAVVKLQLLDDEKANLIVHSLQLRPKMSCKTLEYHKMINVSPRSETSVAFKVKGGLVLELVLAKFWTEQSDSKVDYSISFLGCRPEADSFIMHHADGIMSIEVLGGLQTEEISPTIQLKHNVNVLKPSESKVSPLGARDVIPPGRQIYQLVLTYNFHLPKTSDVSPNSALLSPLLYESEFESQLWILFDINKQVLAFGDAFPSKYSIKLEKGEYVLKQQVRHEKRDLLEKLTELPLLLAQKIANQMSLDVYGSHSQAVLAGKKVSCLAVPPGHYRLPLFVPPLSNERVNKNVSVGQYLLGSIIFSKHELGKKVDGYKFRYVLSEGLKKTTNSLVNTPKSPEKSKLEEYKDALRDLKTNWLSKMDNDVEAEKLYAELKTEYPEWVGVHTAMLASLEPESKRTLPGAAVEDEASAKWAKCLSIADSAIGLVDQPALLAHLGIKADHRPNASTIKTTMERQKSAIVEALNRKGVAACKLAIMATPQSSEAGDGSMASSTSLGEIDEIWLNLLRFADPSDFKTTGHFGIWHAAAHGQYGRALKILQKIMDDKPNKEVHNCIVWCCTKLGWNFAVEHLVRSTMVLFPLSYRLF